MSFQCPPSQHRLCLRREQLPNSAMEPPTQEHKVHHLTNVIFLNIYKFSSREFKTTFKQLMWLFNIKSQWPQSILTFGCIILQYSMLCFCSWPSDLNQKYIFPVQDKIKSSNNSNLTNHKKHIQNLYELIWTMNTST